MKRRRVAPGEVRKRSSEREQLGDQALALMQKQSVTADLLREKLTSLGVDQSMSLVRIATALEQLVDLLRRAERRENAAGA